MGSWPLRPTRSDVAVIWTSHSLPRVPLGRGKGCCGIPQGLHEAVVIVFSSVAQGWLCMGQRYQLT